MRIHVQLTREPIAPSGPSSSGGTVGAWVDFAGMVRGDEGGEPIAALEYEAYDSMAKRVMHELLEQLGRQHGCTSAQVIHRLGVIPVGDLAIWIGVGSPHRHQALALVTDFMNRLKQDVPIWKRRALAPDEVRGGAP